MSFRDETGRSCDFATWDARRKAMANRIASERVTAPNGAVYDVRTCFEGLSDEPWECAVTLVSGRDALGQARIRRFADEASAMAGHDAMALDIQNGVTARSRMTVQELAKEEMDDETANKFDRDKIERYIREGKLAEGSYGVRTR